MIAPSISINAENAIRAFAELKNVSVYKVLFNAMKDFLSEAYRVTPVAHKEVLWALLTPNRLGSKSSPKPLRGNKEMQWLPLDRYTGRQLEHLNKYRYHIAMYWSKASWIAAMKMLGFQKKGSSSDPAAANAYRLRYKKRMAELNTVQAENLLKDKLERNRSTLESITLIDRIGFDKRPGTEQAIIQAGEAKAARNIAREWDKQVRKRWGI